MSSAQTRRSFSPSGTSPATIRCASPSTIAVLPTPGSPISTGLFFVRRREHLDHAADLLVAADHRVELPGLGGLGQVAAELLERLVAALGILRGDALAAAHLLDPREDLVARHGLEREEEVLGRDVVVLELAPLVVGAVEHPRERRRDVRLLLRRPARSAARRASAPPRRAARASRRRAPGRAARAAGGRGDLGVAAPARELLRGGDRLLRLDGQPVEIHVCSVLVRFVGRAHWRSVHQTGLGAVVHWVTWLPAARGAAAGGRGRGRGGTGGAPVERAAHLAAPSARAGGACAAARPRVASTRSTPARFSPSSVVSRWISRSRSTSLVGVEARVARGALRPHEPLLLVDAQRLRMHADELGGDADHVARPVAALAYPPAFCSCSSSSRCFFESASAPRS